MKPNAPLLPWDHEIQPKPLNPSYKTSVTRATQFAPISLGQGVSELSGPVFGPKDFSATDNDLLRNFSQTGEPIGERIILHGQVLDENAHPVPGSLIEIWQANASGRYRHDKDSYIAAMDPNFGGAGRTLSDALGHYAFRTIKPGAYPWRNDSNSWRPAHIHVSITGPSFAQRLITQLYFEGDPLVAQCPIAQSIPDASAIDRLIARMDMDHTVPFDAIAYRFDIILRGRRMTWFESE